MKCRLADVVVLNREVPEEGLKAGEVEFITATGRTAAVVTLDEKDVRSVGPNDLRAVRPLRPRRR